MVIMGIVGVSKEFGIGVGGSYKLFWCLKRI